MSSAELQELLSILEATPAKIQSLLSEIPEGQLRRRPSEGQFSCVENVCHLRDIEVEGYTARINRILNEERPQLADIDGGQLAVERAYNNQDVHEAWRAFARARTESVSVLAALDPEEWRREGTLEGVGTVKLVELLTMMRDHDAAHLKDIEQIRLRILELRF